MTARLLTFSALLATTLLLTGCQNKAQTSPTARKTESAYKPASTSRYRSDTDTTSANRYSASADATLGARRLSASADSSGPASATDDSESLAPTLASTAGGRVHTVQKGDTLYKLARMYYNDQAKWREIWNANRSSVPNANQLRVGTQLRIP